jgi:hypothetical protein
VESVRNNLERILVLKLAKTLNVVKESLFVANVKVRFEMVVDVDVVRV